MVRDTISYAGDVILTIYHKGFDSEIGHRKIKRVEKVGRYNIIFEEKVVKDDIIDSLADWDGKIEGLLNTLDNRNPYGERACAYMAHYFYLDKPKKLFLLQEGKYHVNIPTNHFNQIILFTKKYTGLDLHDQAMCFGDTFVYECYQIDIRAKGDEGIIIKVDSHNYRILVNFKLDNIVVCTRIEQIHKEDSIKEIEVLSDRNWNSVDIQIYEGDQLVYNRQDISFMRTIVLDFAIKGNGKRVRLNKLGDDFVIEDKGNTTRSIIGEQPDGIRDLIFQSNNSIKQRLSEEGVVDDKFLFISPGELVRARDCIVGVLRSASDKVWIFDPYFSERDRIMISLDWIRILAYCKAPDKHIVFWNNESRDPITAKEFAKISLNDRIITDLKKKGSKLGIHFYQSKIYIHDRFIFAVSGEKIECITVGTSLNSLDSNYYCINTLNRASSRKIYDNLKNLIDNVNITDYATI